MRRCKILYKIRWRQCCGLPFGKRKTFLGGIRNFILSSLVFVYFVCVGYSMPQDCVNALAFEEHLTFYMKPKRLPLEYRPGIHNSFFKIRMLCCLTQLIWILGFCLVMILLVSKCSLFCIVVRILSDMRTLSADWMANTGKPETEMQSYPHSGEESRGTLFYPRPVAPTSAQVSLYFLIWDFNVVKYTSTATSHYF